jgi:riboflavin biosynthesis pyrimidine reductase
LNSSGKGLVTFGGVHTGRSLVAANLVDEYWLKVNPAIVGRGGSMSNDMVGVDPICTGIDTTKSALRCYPE